MNLLSAQFWLIVLVALAVYYMLPQKYRWALLLVTSLYFYSLSGYKNFLYILGTTLTSFCGAVGIDKINQEKGGLSKRKDKEAYATLHNKARRILITVLCLNFAVLLFLKYYAMPADLQRLFFPHSTLFENWPAFRLLMPLGISFYTFQAMGYVIDIFRAKYEATRHLGKYALFVSYFPQVIQGPISRFDQLYPQFETNKPFDFDRIKKAALLILWGFFKKLVIADRASVLVNHVYGHYQDYTGITIFIGALFYAIQIYGDFSGGIDIIRGVSEAFGIDLVDNFRRPYFARSVSDFWKRWHITLGQWMRDYVFYSLALSKRLGKIGRATRRKLGNHLGKQVPAAIASLIVFLIVGAWHGSSFKFIAYGLYNGLFVLSEPLLEPVYKRVRKTVGINDPNSSTFVAFTVLRTLAITSMGRIFSRAASYTQAIDMFRQMFRKWNPWVLFDRTLYTLGLDQPEMTVLFFALLLVFVASFTQEKGIDTRQWLKKQPVVFRYALVIALICVIVIYGYYGPLVSETDFIYGGF